MKSVFRLAFCAAVLAVSSAWAQSYDSLESTGVRFATGATSSTKVERMRITQGGLIGISNTAPIAKLDVSGDISTSGVIQVSGSALTCSSAIKGAIRYSNTSSTLEYCNSTAWTSVGPSATSVPAFHAQKGSDQTVSAGVNTVVTFDSEAYDTNNNFDLNTERFTPTVPGKYLVSFAVDCGNATSNACSVQVRKNGSTTIGATQGPIGNGYVGNQVTVIVDMNGTDYLEGLVNQGSTTVRGIPTQTFLTGILISMAGGGGGTTPGGTDTQVQFNDGGSALGGDADYTWNKTSNVLTVTGTASATALNGANASLTTIYNPGTFSGNAMAANNISVTYVSSSVVQVSGSALTCSSAIKGDIRYSNTSSTIEYCNSTAWTSMGPSGTQPISFKATNGSAQSFSASTYTELNFATEEFDTNANYNPAGNRFTATVPGKYLFTANALITGLSTAAEIYIYKNGVQSGIVSSQSGTGTSAGNSVSGVLDMAVNDYVEVYAWANGSPVHYQSYNQFSGVLLSPQGSGSGATPGGTDTQVQFNDGGSVLGGDADYTWNKTTNVLTVTGDINYTGLLTDTSDRRQKKNIQEFSGDALERLMKLRPVTFQMKQGGSGVEYGFIAQDVLPLFPELVRDRDDTLSLNYIGLMAPMVKAMQEMKAENDVVAAQNRQLRDSPHILAAEVKTLRRDVLRSQNNAR